MAKKIIVVASYSLGVSALKFAKSFEPEPILITNNRLEFNQIKVLGKTPSKYINKPKNNFKKR